MFSRVSMCRSVSSVEKAMLVERVKYVIWAADTARAVRFYGDCFGGRVVRHNPAITELEICGAAIGIHSGGEGKRTWTGLTFQVPDVVVGARDVEAAGGGITHEPQPENGEPPHLAMCIDTEGNEFMLTRARH
jgi:predicted enzyme related to lactoylglutathione lyase